jgi:hypothetical protein
VFLELTAEEHLGAGEPAAVRSRRRGQPGAGSPRRAAAGQQ